MRAEGLEFSLLGPVEAYRGGERLRLGGGKQRALLARLLLDAGAVVSVDALVDDLWGERPPATARHAIQVGVSSLRKALGEGVLVTRAPGYVAAVDPAQTDVGRFDALLDRARSALDADRPSDALAAAEEALALWRGRPLADLDAEPFVADQARRLEELHLVALERRGEAQLALGREGELVAELERLVAQHPLRERFRAQLMLALYRTGRQAEALAVYQDARRLLVEELGIDPSAELQQLERSILNQDVALAPTPAAPRRLPTGTVTFLFTDVEGSTRLLRELGPERYGEALADHRRAIRDAVAPHGGVEVDTQGDAFFFAFPTAPGALAAARAVVDALGKGPIRVRMGLHTGSPLLGEEGYVGEDVHRAARIAAAAHGGQALVSTATARLVPNAALRDLGEHRLRDLGVPERLLQLGPGEFPPLRTLHQTNLPVQPTALVGRERELAELGELLREHRLVTLLGPGGSGKTRLSLAAAAQSVDVFPDGVWWVPLQALRDPALLDTAVAQALGASGSAAEHIGDKRLLLLLDNFEQLLDAAGLVAELLGATPDAKLLVTSREPLRVPGERRYAVEPLPPADARELFYERALAVSPEFVPTAAVDEICSRLDGLPLAIELAAARVATLEPHALLARLDRRLPLLTTRSRAAPERQRTLRATIEWSHELLDEEERRLFARLAVFAGSFDLEAAEAVCEADLDVLGSLVEKSLVRRWGSGRYGMLETIHEFAAEQVVASPEHATMRRAHARFCADLVTRAEPELRAGDQDAWLRRVGAEEDNLRGALEWAATAGERALFIAIAGYGWRYWYTRGRLVEGRTWLEEAARLVMEHGVEDHAAVAALAGAGAFALLQGDHATARSRAGAVLAAPGEHQRPLEQVMALFTLAFAAQNEGDADLGREHLERAEEVARAAADPWLIGVTAANLADNALHADRSERAVALAEEALPLLTADRHMTMSTLQTKAAALLALGRTAEAEPLLEESLRCAAELDDLQMALSALVGLAAVDVGGHRYRGAARRLAAADRLLDEMHYVLNRVEEAIRNDAAAAVRSVLAPDELDAIRARFRRIGVDELLAAVAGE